MKKKQITSNRHFLYMSILIISTCLFCGNAFSASITVTSPNGAEQIAGGSMYLIQWTSVDIFSDVRIEYSVDNGSNWADVIAQDVPDTGSYYWFPVPEQYTQNGLIRIYSVNDPLVNDVSDATFYIYKCVVDFQADSNFDCYINLDDLMLLAAEWLMCGNPMDLSCNTPCQPGYSDCDAQAFNGCEINTQNNPNHCGACGVVCAFPNAIAECINGACVMGNCLPGYYDVNGDPIDGCEANCPNSEDPDLPDDNFEDSNCDGIDGELDKAIFVDRYSGNDGNSGLTPAQPRKTIQQGIVAAVVNARPYVLISKGIYSEVVLLESGVSLHGRYDAANGWARNINNFTIISGASKAVLGDSVSDIIIAHLDIITATSTSPGVSTYAVYLTQASDIDIQSCQITTANGSNGPNGSNGNFGSDGQPGQAGDAGCEDDTLFCDSCTIPQGGAAGNSPASNPGGDGGDPGHGSGPGIDGQPAIGGASGGQSGNSTFNGQPGTSGQDGYNGSNGTGGLSFGSILVSGYALADGGNATGGTDGFGGGGGGGGGGGVNGCQSYGGHGGGGGGGASAGGAGNGGTGGGGSFAIWAYQCTAIDIFNCTIKTGNGGNGGYGGSGSPGGSGGNGASGGVAEDDSGFGGNGGDGGDAGNGGHGGGGGGGPSIGVLADTPAAWLTNIQVQNNFVLGNPGAGGLSLVNAGSAGISAEVYTP